MTGGREGAFVLLFGRVRGIASLSRPFLQGTVGLVVQPVSLPSQCTVGNRIRHKPKTDWFSVSQSGA